MKTGKHNDKLYYSINLSSSKWIIFFDTVHSSVRAKSWRENNRIPLIVWGHFVWISLHSLVYYVSFQKLKFEFYTHRSCKTVHECQDTKKQPSSQPKRHSICKLFSENNCQCVQSQGFLMNLMCQEFLTPSLLHHTSMSQNRKKLWCDHTFSCIVWHLKKSKILLN